MIVVVTSDPRERAAFAQVCDSRGWPRVACDSVRACKRVLARLRPGVILTRARLRDGYSEDILAAPNRGATRVIVLAPAGTPSTQEARQIALGADCVLRDPVRIEVLLEYLERHLHAPAQRAAKRVRRPRATFRFATAIVSTTDRTISRGSRTATLTPRELQLAQTLAEARGAVVSYEELYHEILGRPFHGDTSNMRVLLGKLDASFRAIGVELRRHVDVIAKNGYRCRGRSAGTPRGRVRAPVAA